VGVFDQAARFAASANPEAMVQRVLRDTRLTFSFNEWFDTRTLSLPGDHDHTADLIAILDDPRHPDQPWLLVFEFESRPNPEKIGATLEETVLLLRNARHGDDRKGRYKVMPALVYLTGTCPVAILDMTMPGGFGTRHVPLVWEIGNETAATILDAVAAGETSWSFLFWIPLMVGAEKADIVKRWRELVEERITDKILRSHMMGIARIFAELAGCYLEWERGLEVSMLTTESQVVNRWIEASVAEADLRNVRKFLLIGLERFGEVIPPSLVETINTQTSVSLLQDWFNTAMQVKSIQEFLTRLRQIQR